MIREIRQEDVAQCVKVIRDSFFTVAEEFGFTEENAPRFTAFATDEQRINWHLNGEHRPMFGYFEGDRLIGYYSLLLQKEEQCELNNLCVLPEYRHRKIGTILLEDACRRARELHCRVMNIGIVEENTVLKKWYEKNGFFPVGTEKFDFFPFTCGYMRKQLD